MNKKIILKGTPASPGKIKAKVRLVLKPEDSAKLQPGEILVASETNPEYTLAIIRASAIVTDLGGMLSHPAIVARELGIPAVVGTKDSTKILKNGIKVTVDGDKGHVLK